MKHVDILIIGSGLYGSVMAERLNTAGYKVLIVEKRNTIGGNCASIDMNGIDVHLYGPHVFHTSNKDVWKYITQFSEFRQFIHKVMSIYKDNVYNFPINIKTKQDFLNNEFNETWFNPDEEIYNAFFKGYSEKQWNCKFEDVPKQALKRIPQRTDYNDSYFNDFYQGIPVKGYYELFFNMLKNIKINFDCDYLKNKDVFKADKIIYTGPIDAYFNHTFGTLGWRSLNFKFKKSNIKDFQGISVMHYPERKYDYTRITEFKHFNPFNEAFNNNFTVYAEEYPCKNDNEPYYPIRSEKDLLTYEKYYELSRVEKNVHFAGRLGSYQYNDMDVTVENALSDFYKIINGELFK